MNPGIAIGLAFFIMIFGGGAVIITYLFMQRTKNAAKAENHVWIMLVPKSAGMERNYRQPIEVIDGLPSCRVPDMDGHIDEDSPVLILGEDSCFSAMYPPGKMKFVQCPMQKAVYLEGDMEPLSNRADIPVVSGQSLAKLVNGVATASVDLVRRSQEDSGVMHHSVDRKAIFLYIMLGATLIASIVAAIFAMKAGGAESAIKGLEQLIKQALGMQ